MANQVPVVAILMIVQGALELIMGAFYVVAALFVRSWFGMMGEAAAKNPGFQQGPPGDLQTMSTMVLVVYLAMGAAGLVAGLLHLVAGIRNVRYRGRTFG